SHDSPVPADLHHAFVVAVTITNLIFWVVLGALSGYFRLRFAMVEGEVRERLAGQWPTADTAARPGALRQEQACRAAGGAACRALGPQRRGAGPRLAGGRAQR